MVLDARLVEELGETFKQFASGGDLNLDAIGELFKACGEPLPAYRMRELVAEYDVNKDGCINFEEFLKMFESLENSKVIGGKFRAHIKEKAGVESTRVTEKSAEGTKHSVVESDRKAFSRYISVMLKDDDECDHLIPIKFDSTDLFEKVKSGVILCKLINLASPGTIDKRAINVGKKLNKFTTTENLNLALNSARAIGIFVVNISAEDIMEGSPHLVLGLVWQILKLVLFAKINLRNNPNLAALLYEGETIQQLLALSPEEILMRWVNYQLGKAGNDRRITNFGNDFKDSEVYSVLSDRCLSEFNLTKSSEIMAVSSKEKRADMVIDNFENADMAYYLTAHDILKGNQNLNLAFLANLFNNYPALEEVEPLEVIEETREEKMYRNWMNSLGVKPKVNYLYTDLNDGKVLLQLLDIIKPGIIDWKKVSNISPQEAKARMQKVENCNKVVEIAKSLKISLIGTAGDDIVTGNVKLTLGLLFQMMREYTLKLLRDILKSDKPITDDQIVEWANGKCDHKISNFKDPSIQTSMPLLKLINAIQPGSINFTLVNNASDYEEKLQNAQFTVSCARKIGARVYALPEDIVEGKFKMIMTIYACLMVRDLNSNA